MQFKIRKCTESDIPVLAKTIREAFRDVAQRFGLTPENAPRHPSNCTEAWVEQEMRRGTVYYALETGSRIAGCVALERIDSDVCYLERLAVHPECRRQGFGESLVEHVFSEASRIGRRHVNIGIIAAHSELKAWYEKLGFIEGETKSFPHLPFRVTFMSVKIS